MIKRTSLDAVFSDCVRESADWTCQNYRCKRVFPDRKGQDIHCSHFISRSYNSTRFFPDNALCLCAKCHDEVGKNPDLHVTVMREILGEVRYAELLFRKHQIVRHRNGDRAAMRKHYRRELERMRVERANGATGCLEFVSYD